MGAIVNKKPVLLAAAIAVVGSGVAGCAAATSPSSSEFDSGLGASQVTGEATNQATPTPTESETTAAARLTPPRSVDAVPSTTGIALSWSAPKVGGTDVAEYVIEVNGEVALEVASDERSAQLNGLTPDAEQRITITARTADGEEASTSVTTFTKAAVSASKPPKTSAPASPDPSQDSGKSATEISDDEIEYVKDHVEDILEDIETVDYRLGDGITVSSALYLLSDSYARLGNDAVPPGVSESKYLARLATLSDFAWDAAEIYDYNSMEGTAKYMVLRKETTPVLDDINAWLGTNYQLPN